MKKYKINNAWNAWFRDSSFGKWCHPARRRARGAKLWMFCPQWVTSNFHPGSTKNYNIPSSQQLFVCAHPVLKLRKL